MLDQLQLCTAGAGGLLGSGGHISSGSQRRARPGSAAAAGGGWEGGGGRPPPRHATLAAAALLAPSAGALQLAAGGRVVNLMQQRKPGRGPGGDRPSSRGHPGTPRVGGAAAAAASDSTGAMGHASGGGGAYESGGTAQIDLVGEIDGLIRRIEASTTSTGQQAQAASGSSKQQTQQRVLGSGGFGVVYKGEWRGLPVAIKVVLLQEGDTATRRQRLVREVALTATLSHPHIVPTY
ncbi:hypothetical protein TSOC_014911, partial [Tetrabaena socialis]